MAIFKGDFRIHSVNELRRSLCSPLCRRLIFFVQSRSKYIVCFLLRSEEELKAVKETHKEPERLTDKVSAFNIYSCFLNFTLFPCQNLIFGGGLFLIGVLSCSWRWRAWRRCAEVSTGCPATTNQTEAKQCGSSKSLLLIWTHLNISM